MSVVIHHQQSSPQSTTGTRGLFFSAGGRKTFMPKENGTLPPSTWTLPETYLTPGLATRGSQDVEMHSQRVAEGAGGIPPNSSATTASAISRRRRVQSAGAATGAPSAKVKRSGASMAGVSAWLFPGANPTTPVRGCHAVRASRPPDAVPMARKTWYDSGRARGGAGLRPECRSAARRLPVT